jgi:hypothetical protein
VEGPSLLAFLSTRGTCQLPWVPVTFPLFFFPVVIDSASRYIFPKQTKVTKQQQSSASFRKRISDNQLVLVNERLNIHQTDGKDDDGDAGAAEQKSAFFDDGD